MTSQDSQDSQDSQVGAGLTTQTCTCPTTSRRNSFDMVMDMANAPAAGNITSNGNDPQTSCSTVNESSPYQTTSASSSSVTCSRTKKSVDHGSQEDTFKEIELQEWPSAERLAAMNSAIAGSFVQAHPTFPGRVCQPSPVSESTRQPLDRPSSDLASGTQSETEEIGLWGEVVAILGSMIER
jgi:hypothetical protein